MVAGPDPSLLTQPSRAIKRALDQVDKQVTDLDLFELNEAFAAVGARVDARPRHHRRRRERERRRDRARSPDRHVGHARRAHARSTSCAAAAAGSVPRRCAAAAARAKPPSSARCKSHRVAIVATLPLVQAEAGRRSIPGRCAGPVPRCSPSPSRSRWSARRAGVPCPLRSMTGVPCPFCGMTRGVTAAVHGNVVDAARSTPAACSSCVAPCCCS